MTASEDRRRHDRVHLDARLRMRTAGTHGPGRVCRVRDASTGGVRIEIDDRLDGGARLVELFSESGSRAAGELVARVVWTAEHGNGAQLLGCAFRTEIPRTPAR